jgi:Glutathione S-transferase, C-terminal domain
MLAMGRTGFPQKEMDAAMQRLRRTYERMDSEIEKSGEPWLLGEEISLADIALMPAVVRMADLGQETAWQDLPRVQGWYDAICMHPAFRPTYYPGSLLTERFSAFALSSVRTRPAVRRRIKPARPPRGEHDRDDIAGQIGGIGMQHIISVIEQHGLLVVFLNVLLAQSGLPLPAFPTLMAAGALVTQSRYQVHEIIFSGVSGSLIADLAWYWSGERYGRRILRLLCKMSLSPDFCVRQTETAFAKALDPDVAARALRGGSETVPGCDRRRRKPRSRPSRADFGQQIGVC